MKTSQYLLPSLALGLAALLVVPGERSFATFTLNGSQLGLSQRDLRVFDNFSDGASNNNVTPDVMYPGYTGAEMAIWKGAVEWGSTVHGDGSGDPVQTVGDGGANFDPAWNGNASGIGNTDNNIVSAISSCSSGVIAFAELPSGNGWRIRFCDGNFVFADGPGFIGAGAFDIQGIMTHEYGHVIGLGHSCTGQATMAPSGAPGSVSERSLHADDIAGIQAIYGVRAAAKPSICETSVSGGSITIRGSNFSSSGNEVWFTNPAVTGTGVDPRVIVTNVDSTGSGTLITVAIPAGAGPGDVLVKKSGTGGTTLSNAFPTDLVGTITAGSQCPLTLSSATPSDIPILQPGTAQEVTLMGTGFLQVTEMKFNLFENIPSTSWTIVNDTTITLDMPQAQFLGGAVLSVSDGTTQVDLGVNVVEVASPQLQLGSGDPFEPFQDGDTMEVVVAGVPGSTHRIYYSGSPVPSIHPKVEFDMGNNFTELFVATAVTIGANGITSFDVPIDYTGPAMDFYSQAVDLSTPPSPQFGVSNLQSLHLTP